MSSLRVMTWNVLHRVHAVNWKEPPVEHFPDESVRIERIAAFIAAQLDTGIDVVCLQEVSGDQRARLTQVLGQRAAFFAHCYPRIPTLRDKAAAMKPALTDPAEYLVMLVAEPLAGGARQHGAETFANDFGKGYLAVDLSGGILAVDTHVTWGERGHAQLAQLARLAAGPAFLAGDFNAKAAAIAALLHPDAAAQTFALTDLGGQRHTRTATSEKDSYTIDHILVRQGSITSATVLDGEGLSDHHPVIATLQFPS